MPDIDFQRIELNLIPKKGDEPVVFYASQYETARPFIADLMWGESEFAPGDDCWAEIDIRKNDDNLVVITDDVVIDNNEVSVVLPIQALTCIGKNLGQVKIYAADDQLIAALNFIIEVQPDPLAGGVQSETAIDNLTQQIEDIATEVIGEDYYDKTEVDALLADKADASTTYTKTEVDNALELKANSSDLATVATTGDYDDLINKPTIPAAQIQSDYAQADNTQVDYIKNKPDISGMIAAVIFDILPVGTATGNPCTFDTAIAANLQSCTAGIVATGGGGTSATPVPIVGYNAVNLDANGTTVTVSLGQTVYGGVLDIKNGSLTVTHTYKRLTAEGFSHPATWATGAYLSSVKTTDAKPTAGFADSTDIKCNVAEMHTPAQISAGTEGIGIGNGTYLYVNFGTTYSSVELLDDYLNNNEIYIAYELATPIEITGLTPTDIQTILGVNNITSDVGGDVTVGYKDTIQHYIDERT